jgi:Mitochondrial carrier protein
MQVSGAGIGPTVSALYAKEGVAAFWKGLVFAYGRELSYTSIKLGAYAPVRDMLGAGKDAPFYLKFLAGAITGGVGSFIGNVRVYYTSPNTFGFCRHCEYHAILLCHVVSWCVVSSCCFGGGLYDGQAIFLGKYVSFWIF